MTLDFMELWARWPDVPAHVRSVAFGSLPQRAQDECWAVLAAECEERTESERAERYLDPPKRRSPHHGTPTSTSTSTPGRVQFDHDDPLSRIPAAEYLPVLAGVDVSSSGRCRCPMPDHEDLHPSAKACGARWHCFSCGAGGSIIGLAAALYGIPPRGSGYWDLRDLIVEALHGTSLYPRRTND